MKNNPSVITSLITAFFLSAVLLLLAFTAPMLTKMFISYFYRPAAIFKPVVITFYTILPLAAGVLFSLIRLLLNIANDNVFISENVTLLRVISILLAAATIVFAIAGYFYMPFYLLAAFAAFMVIIVRVVKNCFAAAVVLKDENDMTI
ncbi:MAG: DUF2975 domain-containing protein [Ruminococcaceae bacterium]|nr:DUF2975 domain-containing protein [Oscillospiraceae bacterium]